MLAFSLLFALDLCYICAQGDRHSSSLQLWPGRKAGGEGKTLFVLSKWNKYWVISAPEAWCSLDVSQVPSREGRQGCKVAAVRILLSFFSLSTLCRGGPRTQFLQPHLYTDSFLCQPSVFRCFQDSWTSIVYKYCISFSIAYKLNIKIIFSLNQIEFFFMCPKS